MRTGVLRHRSFRLLFAGQAVSAVGDRLAPVALAFAVLDLTGSVGDLGIVLAAYTAALALFVLLGGIWADRLARQRVMLGSDALRALAQGVSAWLLLAGVARVWELAALQALYGAAQGFFGPASTAVVPQTVAADELQQANALLGLSRNVAAVLGPALAGVAIAALGAGWGLALDAATFLISTVCLALMAPTPLVPGPRTTMITELTQGWRAFRSRTWVWLTVLFFTLYIAFVFSPLEVLGPQVARTELGGATAWATIMTAIGVGSVLGGLLGLRWRPRYPLRAAFIGFLIAGPALYGLLAAAAPLALIVPAALIDGGSGTFFNVVWFTALQQDVPPAELSRVSSWDYLGTLALQPLGQAVSGPIALAIGVSTTLYAAGVLSVVLIAATLAAPAVRNFAAREV